MGRQCSKHNTPLVDFDNVSDGGKIGGAPTPHLVPEAHVEAPTAGSMLLASVMLKVGGYGLLMGLQEGLNTVAATWLVVWGLVGSIMASIAVIRQTDLKKMIAYSSSAHCALVMPLLAIGGGNARTAAILLLLAHALPSAAYLQVWVCCTTDITQGS